MKPDFIAKDVKLISFYGKTLEEALYKASVWIGENDGSEQFNELHSIEVKFYDYDDSWVLSFWLPDND
jgi:hypothetical protein